MKLNGIKPVDYEEVIGLNGPQNRADAMETARYKRMWDGIEKRNAQMKMANDEYDSILQKSSVNAGQYGAAKKDYQNRVARAAQMEAETLRQDVEDNVSKQSSSPKMQAILKDISSTIDPYRDVPLRSSKPRGSGRAMTKNVNHWKVK